MKSFNFFDNQSKRSNFHFKKQSKVCFRFNRQKFFNKNCFVFSSFSLFMDFIFVTNNLMSFMLRMCFTRLQFPEFHFINQKLIQPWNFCIFSTERSSANCPLPRSQYYKTNLILKDLCVLNLCATLISLELLHFMAYLRYCNVKDFSRLQGKIVFL